MVRQQQRSVAVTGTVDAARLRETVDPVDAVEPAKLDVYVRPAYLSSSYAIYRALRGSSYDAIVFDGADAYCAGRTKQVGTDFESTTLVVRCGVPVLRAAMLERRSFLTKTRLGRGITERLALELADVLVCDDAETLKWMRHEGWKLPDQVAGDVAEALQTASVSRGNSNQAEPLVSVVIPFHERTQYLAFCLDGLARQTYPALEVLVVDDGSASSAAQQLLADIEGRSWPWPLRVVRAPHTGYPGETRNAGWTHARGDLVAFVDDDDVPFDEFVATLVRAQHTSGADVVIAGARLFRGDAAPQARRGDVVHVPLAEPRELGLLGNQFGGPSCLWPRRLLEELGGFRGVPRGFEDWELLARASLAGVRMTAPPDPLYWYRQTPGSVYSADPVANLDDAVASLAALHADQLPDGARWLPLLAAGAYAELERRSRAATPRRRRAVARGRLLVRRTREVREEEGVTGVVRRGVRFLRKQR